MCGEYPRKVLSDSKNLIGFAVVSTRERYMRSEQQRVIAEGR